MGNKDHLVLFDIGGVLLKLDYQAFYNNIAAVAGITPKKFRELYTSSEIENAILVGNMNTTEYLAEIKNILQNPSLSNEKLIEIISTSWKAQSDEVVNLKKRIHQKGYTIGLLSNISKLAQDVLSKKHPKIFKTYGGPEIYSYKIGHIKPNSPMYEKAQSLGFKKITYIDDSESYVKKGTEMGWDGILFTAFIDNAEAMSQILDTGKIFLPKKHSKRADNIQELEKALIDFGIKFID